MGVVASSGGPAATVCFAHITSCHTSFSYVCAPCSAHVFRCVCVSVCSVTRVSVSRACLCHARVCVTRVSVSRACLCLLSLTGARPPSCTVAYTGSTCPTLRTRRRAPQWTFAPCPSPPPLPPPLTMRLGLSAQVAVAALVVVVVLVWALPPRTGPCPLVAPVDVGMAPPQPTLRPTLSCPEALRTTAGAASSIRCGASRILPLVPALSPPNSVRSLSLSLSLLIGDTFLTVPA
jgi:hypothetical protein